VQQRGVFDPSVKHFMNAFSAGEPVFEDAELGRRWRQTQLRVMGHVLAAIAASRVGKHMVLRGSMLMHAWFGSQARAPHDLDFLVDPPTIMVGRWGGDLLLNRVLKAISAVSDVDEDLRLDTSRVAREELWTYERAPGLRLVVPWTGAGLPAGVVQMDFVFSERLPQPPALTQIPVPGRDPVSVLAAGPELSLAWKLLWLETDMYPQGKDLYDAVLLAERWTVPLDLVRRVLSVELGELATDFTARSVLKWDVDWDNFIDEYPEMAGTAQDWQLRLAQALTRSFAG
jgi:hypothetical protein